MPKLFSSIVQQQSQPPGTEKLEKKPSSFGHTNIKLVGNTLEIGGEVGKSMNQSHWKSIFVSNCWDKPWKAGIQHQGGLKIVMAHRQLVTGQKVGF